MVDPVIDYWEDPSSRSSQIYESGSWGPEAAYELLTQNGHKWVRSYGGHGDSNE